MKQRPDSGAIPRQNESLALVVPYSDRELAIEVLDKPIAEVFVQMHDHFRVRMGVEVMATGLIPEDEVQLNIFEQYNGIKNNKLSSILDGLNKHYGKSTIRMATEGRKQKWAMRREFLSPGYTTDWNDIIKVK